MAKHIDQPAVGVDALIEFLQNEGAQIMAAEAELVFSISEVEKDGDRAARQEEVRERLRTVRMNFEGTFEKFMAAAQADDKARAKLAEFRQRLREAKKAIGDGGLSFF